MLSSPPPPPRRTETIEPRRTYICPLRGPLSKKECLEALKSMASEKTPGSDGLRCEFYKVFWNDLAKILLNALNFSFETGQLSISQKRGIVKLIPNCGYEIASKAIASRIKTFLPKLISDDQTGFLKGRCISENIRLLDSVIKYTERRNISGLLLFIDFEKAFDTLVWSFISKTLLHFGFKPSLLNWIELFYCNIESCILNNVWASNFF